MAGIRHVNCPQCGGTLGAHGLERIVRCRYCRTWSLVEAPDLIPEYWVKPKLNNNQARRSLQKLLTEPGMPQGMLKLARFHSAQLHFIPYHEVSARRTGLMTLTIRAEQVRMTSHQKDELPPTMMGISMLLEEERKRERSQVPKKDTRVVLNDVARLEPAVELADWRLEEAELSRLRTAAEGALQPINRREMERLGVIHSPTLSTDQIIAQMELRAGTTELDDRTEYSEVRAKRIFYPVWRVRYQYQGRFYGATLDAVTGRVMSARAPQDDRSRVLWLIAMSALACLLPGKILQSILGSALTDLGLSTGLLDLVIGLPQLVVPVFLFGLAAIIIILGVGWDEFRYAGEIVIHGDHREVVKINRPETTKFDWARDAILHVLDQGLKNMSRRTGS